jgi:hypothetical protein
MTISFSGGTGSPAASAQGSTSISVAYPAFVAAGRIALLYACVKLDTATFNTTITDWNFIGEQAGGTGSAANDAGTTKIAAWYRILDGSESGSVTVTNTGGNSSSGLMDIYQGTVGGWAVPEFVGGADTTHGTAWSVTGGTWANALAVGDWITLPMSTDTDIAQSITSRALTQTGITWAGNFFRSRSLSTTGFDSGVYSFDWNVTAGSNTNAPTNVHTSGTANCGAQLFIRLREQAAPVDVDGDLAVTAGLSADADVVAAAVDVDGALAATAGLSADATQAMGVGGSLPVTAALSADAAVTAGGVDVDGALAATAGLSADVASVIAVGGSLAATAAVTADATRTISVDGSLPMTAATAGTVAAVIGVAAALPVTVGLSADASVAGAAQVDVDGTLAATAGLSADAVRDVNVDGALAASVGLTAAVASVVGVDGTLAVTVGLSADASVVPAVVVDIDGTRPVTVGLTADVASVLGVDGALPITVDLLAVAAVTPAVAPRVPRPGAGFIDRPGLAVVARPFAGLVPRL